MKNLSKVLFLFLMLAMAFAVISCEQAAGSSPSKDKKTEETKDEPTPTPEPETPETPQTPEEPELDMTETPLTLEFLADGEITITNPWSTLKYSKNGGALTAVEATGNPPTMNICVNQNDKIHFYAEGSETTMNKFMNIACNSDCYIYGNIMSLVTLEADTSNWDSSAKELTSNYCFYQLFSGNFHIKNHGNKALLLPATTLTDSCYRFMFGACNSLTSAPELPATILAPYCYSLMFTICTSLNSAPDLPAVSLSYSCYEGMFSDCWSLTSAPALPATSLAEHCYAGMFSDCNYLTSAPELPATTLVDFCYSSMFYGCSKINYIKCLATDISASGCTSGWLNRTASSGTFIKAAGVNWSTGNNGIPNGWEVYGPDTPLTLGFIESGEVTITDPWSTLKYTINGGEFILVGTSTPAKITVNKDDKISFYAGGTENAIRPPMNINCSSDCYIYGNVMSLVSFNYLSNSWDSSATTITDSKYFENLFFRNSHIKNHKYKPLLLPAKTLSDRCYEGMFYECTSLTSAPELPATTLSYDCYRDMFSGCTSLTTAPELPAPTLAEYCYYNMFYGCSNLNYIKCLATDISAKNCTLWWVTETASSGTFVKAAGTDWSSKPDGDGIPVGWTVEEAQ